MSQALRNRVEELEEEVRQLREQLTPDIQWPHVLGLGRRKQRAILSCLYQRSPRAMSREQLFQSIWPIESEAQITVVQVTICQLRRKLEQYGVTICSTNYLGYWIDAQTAATLRDWIDRGPDYVPPRVQP